MSWASLTSGDAYKSPAFIALVSALCVAIVLLLHHCVLVLCCRGGDGGSDRSRRRQHHQRRVVGGAVTTGQHQHSQQQEEDDDDDASVSVEVSATSRTHLVAAAVVCRYRKEEAWKETTCPVCLADFADGEAVPVLPECMHYFHAECIDTWLRGSTICPLCLADFADGEAARVLPKCMHYFHAECIDTWLRGSTSCPLCRTETTPTMTPTTTPTTTPSPGSVRHHLELSVSLEQILIRT